MLYAGYYATFGPLPVMADYFGLGNIDVILGLYQGMIKIKGMDKSTVEKAYKTIQGKLIHDSYNLYGTSGCYKMFCDYNIEIGKTCQCPCYTIQSF